MARPRRNCGCPALERSPLRTPSARPTGIPRQSRYATSSGNCARASLNIPIERLDPASIGRIPAGIITHRSNANPRPQINPAPGLVARWAKNRPKASPKRPPSNTPCASGVVSSALLTAPPVAPRPNPSRSSIHTEPAMRNPACALIEDSDAAIVRTPAPGLLAKYLYLRSMVWTISRGKKSSTVQSISTRIFRSTPGSFDK